MSKVTSITPWSTILKPSASMPKTLKKGRGIFLGWTKDSKFIRVVTKPSATHSIYTPAFWEVDEAYMPINKVLRERV